MNHTITCFCWALACLSPLLLSQSHAEVGDPQIKTDHPWYPGELAISTFGRLAQTQATVFELETGRRVVSDEDKALASWYWRNLHYAHCQEGTGDYFDSGFSKGQWNREYWHGLFAHGSWFADENRLDDHNRGKPYRRVEAHLAYRVAKSTKAKVTFAWTEDDRETKRASHIVNESSHEQTWSIQTTGKVTTQWVEISAP